FTVANQSSTPASGRWRDRVYLSVDNQVTSDDIVLAEVDNDAALDSGERYETRNVRVTLPRRFTGRGFLIVRTDAGGAIDEYPNDENNDFASAFDVASLPPADLVVSDVVAPAQVIGGATIDVRFNVTNFGSAPTDNSSWSDAVWLTRDRKRPDPRKGDVLLAATNHAGVLKVGDSYEQTFSVTIPGGLNGQYFITPVTDAFDGVTESTTSDHINPDDPNQLDNNSYRARPITVVDGSIPADLVVTSVRPDATGTGGSPFTVRWSIQNQGAAGTASAAWVDVVYLSDQPTLGAPGAIEWELGRVPHTAELGPGSVYNASLSTTLSPAVAGRYVFVKTNVADFTATDGGKPADEGPFSKNNVGAATTTVTDRASDLVAVAVRAVDVGPTGITTPAAGPIYSGEPIHLEWTVRNDGTAVWSGSRYWRDQLFLSRDPDFSPSRSTLLGTFIHAATGELATGASYVERRD
ncbi:MAG TPA: CARDB domain-containing protein, partial [Pirellulaceae bacterium]|nr:CARDB domain-containing protein [Pirellulaceae bacterium]